MAQSHYDWRNGPAEIDPHSVTKHEVLVGYLIRYFEQRTLNARGRERLRITLHGSFNARPWATNLRAVVL